MSETDLSLKKSVDLFRPMTAAVRCARQRPNEHFLSSYSAGVHLVEYIFSNIPLVSFRNRAMEAAF
jgi:hypothetical protein